MDASHREEFDAVYASTENKLDAEKMRSQQVTRKLMEEEHLRKTLQEELEQLKKQNTFLLRDMQSTKIEVAKEFEMTMLKTSRLHASKTMDFESGKNAEILELEHKILKELKDHSISLVGLEAVSELEERLRGEIDERQAKKMQELTEFDHSQKEQIEQLRARNNVFMEQAMLAKTLKRKAKVSVMDGQKRFSTMLNMNSMQVKDMERYRTVLKYFVVNNFVRSYRVKKRLLHIYQCLCETLLDVVRENGGANGEVKEWFSRAATAKQSTSTPMNTIANNLHELENVLKLCIAEIREGKDEWKTKANRTFSHNNEMVEETSKLTAQSKKHAVVIKRLMLENDKFEHKVSHNRFRYHQAKQKNPLKPQNVLPSVLKRPNTKAPGGPQASTRMCMRPQTAPTPTQPNFSDNPNCRVVYAPNLFHTSHWKNYPAPQNPPQIMSLPIDPYPTKFASPYKNRGQPHSKPMVRM